MSVCCARYSKKAMLTQMDIKAFLESPTVALPKTRTNTDFEDYLVHITNEYLAAIEQLDHTCGLCHEILQHVNTIHQVAGWVRGAVRQSFLGQPERAYKLILHGIHMLDDMKRLVTVDIPPANFGPTYRMVQATTKQLSRDRLFHVPFELRHVIGRHRYGIPGFPCLYLGGSLQVCQR